MSDLNSERAKKYGALLSDLMAVVGATLERQGLEKEKSQFLAERVVEELSTYGGGRPIYIPGPSRIKRAIRNLNLVRDFKGDNYPELMQKYGLSDRQCRFIIAEQIKMLRLSTLDSSKSELPATTLPR